jgi:hypothetical protein
MNPYAIKQAYASRTRATIVLSNGARSLNALCKQAIVNLAVKQICSALKLLLNGTSPATGSQCRCQLNEDKFFIDGAGI